MISCSTTPSRVKFCDRARGAVIMLALAVEIDDM